MFLRAPSFPLLAALAAVSGVTTAAPGFPLVNTDASLTDRAASRPAVGNVPYGSEILSCTSPGKIALTFDDGPGPLTSGIVDTLDENGVPATFFVVGKNGPHGLTTGNYDSLIKHMYTQGHQIASHSFRHPDFNTISYDRKVEELEKNEEALAKILGVIPTYFRSPYTSCDDECYKVLGDLGYHVADYDLDTKDWFDGGIESKARYSAAVNAANPRSSSFIVLAHDVQEFTGDGFIQYMIDVGKAKGFEFVTLGDCLGDPSGNWYRNPQSFEAVGGGSPAPSRAQQQQQQQRPSPSPHAHIELDSEEPRPSESSESDVAASSTASATSASTSSSTSTRPAQTSSASASASESAAATDQADSTAIPSSESSADATADEDSAAAMPLPALGPFLLSSLVGVAAWIML
ncbi:carbohydrate esterase family 4 protein [Sodiomyces alcalophilus JCM 7366]|uniref:carbohydrate esterase family 4 protein n=1 Tax=Sodiomyces alcalophilus JCM 7366 TaxID=591952 RepID=UPI0039B57E01